MKIELIFSFSLSLSLSLFVSVKEGKECRENRMNWAASTFHDAMDDWSANVEKCESDFESLSLSSLLQWFLLLSPALSLSPSILLVLILGSRNLHPSLPPLLLLKQHHPHPLHSNFYVFSFLVLECLSVTFYIWWFIPSNLTTFHPSSTSSLFAVSFFSLFLFLYVWASDWVSECECICTTLWVSVYHLSLPLSFRETPRKLKVLLWKREKTLKTFNIHFLFLLFRCYCYL